MEHGHSIRHLLFHKKLGRGRTQQSEPLFQNIKFNRQIHKLIKKNIRRLIATKLMSTWAGW